MRPRSSSQGQDGRQVAHYLTPHERACQGSGISRETVAGASHGLDQAVMSGRLKRLAQAPNVHIHSALLDEDMVAPDMIEQLRARIDALGMRHHEVQETKFRRTECEVPLVAAYAVAHGIESQSSALHEIVGSLWRAPPQYGFHASVELPGTEWLRQIVVRTVFQPGQLVRFLGARGKHDERYVLSALVSAQLACKIDAAHA